MCAGGRRLSRQNGRLSDVRGDLHIPSMATFDERMPNTAAHVGPAVDLREVRGEVWRVVREQRGGVGKHLPQQGFTWDS